MTRNDYKCEECGEIAEFVVDTFTTDLECPKCGCHNMQLVFAKPPQMIIEKASTVAHVIKKNKERMDEIYEEDAAEKSEFKKNIEALTHEVVMPEFDNTADDRDYYG